MATKRRRFTAAFKKRVALEALRGEQPVQAIAAKHQVHTVPVHLIPALGLSKRPGPPHNHRPM